LINPQISRKSPPERVTIPGMSNELAAGEDGVSRSRSRLMIKAAAPTGTLT